MQASAGGKEVALSEEIDVPDSAAPTDGIFDLSWAREVLREAVGRMQVECGASKRPDIWGVFDGRTLGPALRQEPPVPYDQLVRAFNFVSPYQATNVLITANRMFVRVLRSVVAEYEDDADVDAEIADLRRIMSTAGSCGI